MSDYVYIRLGAKSIDYEFGTWIFHEDGPRVNKRVSKKKRDDAHYPFQARYKVPPEGFGKRIDEIFTWLDLEVGRGDYQHNADRLPWHGDCIKFYFTNVEDLSRFAEFFEAKGVQPAFKEE